MPRGRCVSLGTSKINYNDPRITIAWCKAHEVRHRQPKRNPPRTHPHMVLARSLVAPARATWHSHGTYSAADGTHIVDRSRPDGTGAYPEAVPQDPSRQVRLGDGRRADVQVLTGGRSRWARWAQRAQRGQGGDALDKGGTRSKQLGGRWGRVREVARRVSNLYGPNRRETDRMCVCVCARALSCVSKCESLAWRRVVPQEVARGVRVERVA